MAEFSQSATPEHGARMALESCRSVLWRKWRALREGRAGHRNLDKIETSTLPAGAGNTTLVSHPQARRQQALRRYDFTPAHPKKFLQHRTPKET
jgi:hypothetical protein